MDRILLRTVQLWELWRQRSTGLQPAPEEDLRPILREEVEIAVASLKKGKSVGVDNIPAELIQAGGETIIDVLTEICNRIWRTGEWSTPWTQSLIITLPKKGNLQLCQNYRTISLISHSSKVVLKVILNRLKPQAEEIIAEEQAGFRVGKVPQNRSSTLESCVKSTSNISRICTMSSLISKKPLTEYGMQPYGPPSGSTISVQILFAPLSSSMTRLQVQSRWMAA